MTKTVRIRERSCYFFENTSFHWWGSNPILFVTNLFVRKSFKKLRTDKKFFFTYSHVGSMIAYHVSYMLKILRTSMQPDFLSCKSVSLLLKALLQVGIPPFYGFYRTNLHVFPIMWIYTYLCLCIIWTSICVEILILRNKTGFAGILSCWVIVSTHYR